MLLPVGPNSSEQPTSAPQPRTLCFMFGFPVQLEKEIVRSRMSGTCLCGTSGISVENGSCALPLSLAKFGRNPQFEDGEGPDTSFLWRKGTPRRISGCLTYPGITLPEPYSGYFSVRRDCGLDTGGISLDTDNRRSFPRSPALLNYRACIATTRNSP